MAGALDGDAARTLASGRQTIGSMLSTAQDYLKRVFLAFVAGMMLTIWALRAFVWDTLKQDLVYSQMNPDVAERTEIIVLTPFDVILLQVKIGLIMGIIFALPVLVYYSRGTLKQRGIWPDDKIPRWKIVGFVIAIIFLLAGGVAYAYFFFFPIMFNFLAENAVRAGFKPTWSIVKWTEFVFFLSLSFGVAAQLPLAMSASARTGIVSYETFRDKWRYAVVGIFVFGAMFSPPDPFTQIMWGLPLVGLYFISLGITKFAVLSKQAGEQVPVSGVVREYWNQVAAGALVSAAGIYLFLLEGGTQATNDVLKGIGSDYRVAVGDGLSAFGQPPETVAVFVGALAAMVVTVELLFYFRVQELEKETRRQAKEAQAAEMAKQEEETPPGEPAEIDISAMSQQAIENAPAKVFVELSEERALYHAQEAVDNDNPQKGQAILDKFDEVQELDIGEESEEEPEEDESVVTSTAAGMLDPFTEEDTTEDDIGGYYYDITFILESLTSKAIWIVGVFMVVMAGSFMAMYSGGIGYLVDVFFRNLPSQLQEDPEIVVLHPVEALIFMLKFSTLLGFLSILPIVLYFAWPAIEERGITTGNRNVLLVWGGAMFLALAVGTALGFLYIAPTILAILAIDVINANMVIAYRISNFGWLVIYLTVGVGILAMIPTTMLLFVHGNIVSYQRMQKSWRGIVLAFFAAAGFASPKGVFTMFIVAIPASLAYLLGLALLWPYNRLSA